MHALMSKNGVDTHFHVFDAGVAVAGARYVPQYSARLSDWMAQAQSVGVRRGVWVQPSFLGTDNSLMLRALQDHPDMLRGVAVVKPDAQADELQSLHQAGVCGIRLNLAGLCHDIPEWTQAHGVWRFMRSEGWSVEVHTDQGQLPHVLSQLPGDVPLVVDHMAKPMHATADDTTVQSLMRRAKIAPVYVKLSGAYRLGGVDAQQLATLWLNALGPDALLWGSDWPCTNHEQFADFEALMSQARAWVGNQYLEQVMVHNPMRLYWGS